MSNQWISVEERLPEPRKVVDVWVRVTYDGEICGEYRLANCSYDEGWINSLGNRMEHASVISHWMPLPSPPLAQLP